MEEFVFKNKGDNMTKKEIREFEKMMRGPYNKEEDEIEKLIDIADDVLEQLECYENYQVNPVGPTPYKNLKIEQLIQKFEDENFCNFSKQEILDLCTELSIRMSKQLSTVPSIVRAYEGENLERFLMTCKATSNAIEINFDSFNDGEYTDHHPNFSKENIGLLYLHATLHEIYHTVQHYNFNKFLAAMPFEKDTLCSSVQDILSGTYTTVLDTEMETLYNADLIELNSNIFATNTLLKFIEKGYFKNPDLAEISIKNEASFIFNDYDRKSINFAKSRYLKNLKALSKIKDFKDEVVIEGDVYFDKDQVEVLKGVYEFASSIDMKQYQQKMQDKVIKFQQEFRAFAFGKTGKELGFKDDKELKQIADKIILEPER